MSSSRPEAPAFTPAAERVYTVVKEEILNRRLPAGQMVTEGEIAGRFFVSRTPVREALLRLEFEGFLRLIPKRGALVVPVSVEEVADVFEARQLLELHAAAAAFRCSQGLIGSLRASTAALEVAVRDADDGECARWEQDFHTRLLAAAGNDLLAQQYALLRDRERRMTGGTGGLWWSQVAHEHSRLVTALESRDRQAWMGLTRDHVQSARRRLNRDW